MNPFLVVQQNLLKFFNFKREFVVFVASGNDDDDDDGYVDDDDDDDNLTSTASTYCSLIACNNASFVST